MLQTAPRRVRFRAAISCLSPDPPSLPPKGGARFTRTGIAADAVGAAQTRVELGEWLNQQFALSDERLNDLLRATYEALANGSTFVIVTAADDFDHSVDMARLRRITGVAISP